MEVLRETLRDGSLAASINGRLAGRDGAHGTALQHPNGFLKIPLTMASLPATWQLVLRSWRRGMEIEHADVHNHRWDFASMVLTGRLRQEFFVAGQTSGASATAWYAWQYHKGPAVNEFSVVPQGSASLERTVTTRLTERSLCGASAEVLHRVVAESQSALTCVIQGAPRRSATNVYSVGPPSRGVRMMQEANRVDVERILGIASAAVGDIAKSLE